MKYKVLLILAFVTATIGFFLTIYYLFLAEEINRPVFLFSSLANMVIVIFLIRFLKQVKKV